ncbi:THUMP domain-containing class I SAM-dependent RNA methyltransferase [Abyssisolibacter fermentans]|uniref:THUMP domain-containing class I SAM-dependent RNA methyltransferase n=1 Tax=Abyssisolibacter fermentans TaxID=1766203 RepID=UPI000834C256|nr:class I SAM-dependent RNA methyltransferase [Abyssisolibacter fermentans]
MSNIELIATSTFGLEAVVKRELLNLGYENLKVENGKVTYTCNEEGIANSNLWLRTADRVLLKIGEFRAESFEELFQGTKSLPWEEWITEDGEFTVNGKSVKSKLFSISDCQAIVKKAIVERLKIKYNTDWFKETGAKFTVQVSLLNDIATLTIDTSGVGLHKRGYRQDAVEAPIKETLAAAMIQLSYWDKNRVLLDPFCGSGTIPIEAALIGKNIAPGLNRKFVSENWPRVGEEIYKKARVEAYRAIDNDVELKIYASDIDKDAINLAKENSIEAGVDDCINFKAISLRPINIKEKYGIIICNPPYGQRLGEKQEIRKLYRKMGNIFGDLKTWSKYVITSEKAFESEYGAKADRKRKLFNGRIEVNYYQYFGPRPDRREK